MTLSRSQARAQESLDRAIAEGGAARGDPGDQNPPLSAFAGEDDVAQAEARIHSALDRDRRAREELRDLSSASAPDLMRPNGLPTWLSDAYALAGRQVGRSADALVREPLQAGMVTNASGQLVLAAIPRQATGAGVAIQASQNSAVKETDPTTTGYSAPVGTIEGQVDLSRQLFDLSRPGLDLGIATDLGRASGVLLDSQIVSGSGATEQMRGLLNVSGILTATSAATGVQGQISALWSGFRSLSGSGDSEAPTSPITSRSSRRGGSPGGAAARAARASRSLRTFPASSFSPGPFPRARRTSSHPRLGGSFRRPVAG